MSYLLSSLKNAEKQRKQNLCQNLVAHLEQDDKSDKLSSQLSAYNDSVSSLENTNPPEKNLFLENSSNQFSTKKNLTYVFFFSGICFVVIACLVWFYMTKKQNQESKLIPNTAELVVPSRDNLKLKLETELLSPVPPQLQQKSTTTKN